MKKYTINNFSGGIQESTASTDFSPRQWAQLKGIVPLNELTFETQWPIQTVGESQTSFTAVYPLASEIGIFLVAIKNDGTLWWSRAPLPEATHTTSKAVTWAALTEAENRTWSTVFGLSANAKVTLDANREYRFICSFPFEVYKYVKDLGADPLNITLDKDAASAPRAVASAVLLNTALRYSNPAHPQNSTKGTTPWVQQEVVLYVDAVTESVKAVAFPAPRRIPVHKYNLVAGTGTDVVVNADFITTDFIFKNEVVGNDTMPSWPFDAESVSAYDVRHHPFTYRDINGLLNPGTGLMPRANVGCTKGDLMLLGDIEWRTNFTDVVSATKSEQVSFSSGNNTLTTSVVSAILPDKYPATGRVLFNQGPGTVFLSDANFEVPAVAFRVTNRVKGLMSVYGLLDNEIQLTMAEPVPFATIPHGAAMIIEGVGANYDGTFVRRASGTHANADNPLFVMYTKVSAKAELQPRASSGTVRAVATTIGNYKTKVEVGEYMPIPDSWATIFAYSSVANTVLRAASNFNRGTHFLNDNNTGPHRGSFYFSGEDIDTWDPRSVIRPSRTDVRIAGMHTIDDTVIVVTTSGSEGDGVVRVRGYLSKLHPYNPNEQPDPTAVRVELIKGGVGAPERPINGGHKNYSCVWSEAGVVVFVDRLGGVYYTDGQVCDRLDRFGPKQPASADFNDHVASLGNHLFMWRGNRLFCFTMLGNQQGTGSGCWTELSVPSGQIYSMTGVRDSMYFVQNGSVKRFATGGPVAERGRADNVLLPLTVSTATLGSDDDHARTNWHRFGMTFNTPTSCTVGTVRVRGTGALAGTGADGSSGTDPVSYTTTLNRSYTNTSILNEFIVPAGIGTQAAASATVAFTGYVILQSASFWTTGDSPRIGDS